MRFLTLCAPSAALLAGVFALSSAGCASAPPPTARYASSEAAIRAAQELNADATPAAQLHLKLARDQFGQAKRLMADGKNDRAEYLLMRAEADADVAVAIAKETQVRKRASDAIEEVRKARSSGQLMENNIQNQNQMHQNQMNAPAPQPAQPQNNGPVTDPTTPPGVGR